MKSSEPSPPGGGTPSGQNDIGHSFHGVHSFGNSYIRPPPMWRPPLSAQFCGRGTGPFPFPPFNPYGCVPPMFNVPPPTTWEQSGAALPADVDKAWLQKWLQSRPIKKCNEISNQEGVSLSSAQTKLKQWISALEDLKHKYNHFNKEASCLEGKEWNDMWSNVLLKKYEIGRLTSFFGENTLKILERKQTKQIKKRLRLKRQHVEQRKEVHLAQLRCQRLHQKADAWLADMQLAVDRAQKDEKLKKEADSVLAEVTRRQSDGRRQIALLEALQKLHQARMQDIDTHGNKLRGEEKQAASHSNLVFNRLLVLWSKKMEEYAKEEHTLRVMLEETAAKQSDLEVQEVHNTLMEWERCLFGVDDTDNSFDVNSLVSIRYAWDQYLVPDGLAVPMASTIPVGWVLPTTPSSSEWQKYLFEK